jgi:hypothetical protein
MLLEVVHPAIRRATQATRKPRHAVLARIVPVAVRQLVLGHLVPLAGAARAEVAGEAVLFLGVLLVLLLLLVVLGVLVWELVWELVVVVVVVALCGGGAVLASRAWRWWCWVVGGLGRGGCGCWVCGLTGRGLEGGRRWVGVEVLGRWCHGGVAMARREVMGGRGAGVVRVFPALVRERLWSGTRGGSLRLVVSVI